MLEFRKSQLDKTKSIKYLGLTLYPVGNIVGGGWIFKNNFITSEYKLNVDGYSHKELYKIARKNNCSVDIFNIDGKLYIPCTYGFLGITADAYKHIKLCCQYDSWYKWSKNVLC